jgi:hypothetical protein
MIFVWTAWTLWSWNVPRGLPGQPWLWIGGFFAAFTDPPTRFAARAKK